MRFIHWRHGAPPGLASPPGDANDPATSLWRGQGGQRGLPVSANGKAICAVVRWRQAGVRLQVVSVGAAELMSVCRSRSLFPRRMARWPQAAEQADGPAPQARLINRSGSESIREMPARFFIRGVNGRCRRTHA